jgi:transposase
MLATAACTNEYRRSTLLVLHAKTRRTPMSIRYVGIDAHTSSCTIAVMGPTGRRGRQWQVETERKALVEAIRSIARPRHICFEEGALSDWMYELLEPLSDELLVIQPRKTSGVKNDIRDAWAAAEAMRVQSRAVVRVFKAPTLFTALRKASRAYILTQQDLVRVKNRVHACYRSRGLHGFGSAIYDPERRQDWLAKLPPAQQKMTEHFAVELDALVQIHEAAEKWLAMEAKRVPIVELVSTAPGIGLIRASQIVATVLSPHRFRTSRQFWAYCGLGVVMRSSSDYVQRDGLWLRTGVAQTRGLNRNHQPLLKNVFKGAAVTVTHMADHPLQQAYHRMLASGIKPNLARLTLARRISAAVLAMWKNKESYNPTKQMQHS